MNMRWDELLPMIGKIFRRIPPDWIPMVSSAIQQEFSTVSGTWDILEIKHAVRAQRQGVVHLRRER
jgi:hypothetical protein